MALIRILKGNNEGATVELSADRVVLGRDGNCHVVLSAAAVSREHAIIRKIEGSFYIEDNKSRNGTFLNSCEVTTRRLLKNDDKIKICDNVIAFYEQWPTDWIKDDEDDSRVCESSGEIYLPIESWGAATHTKSIRYERDDNWPTSTECERIWECLCENHVMAEYRPPMYERMSHALSNPGSIERRLLATGYHRMVVLDATQGLDSNREFDLDQFFQYVVRQLVEVFSLGAAENTFQPDDIAQILKDEPASLFCFLNAHVVPPPLLTRLRAFTQELHRTVLLLEIRANIDDDH
jgi:pSer/pThr/pTyr-binding forkhead associated (FHA) protein